MKRTKNWIQFFISVHLYCVITLFSFTDRNKTLAVKGCIQYSEQDRPNMKKAICDGGDFIYETIPPGLPIDIVNLTLVNNNIHQLDASQFAHLPNLTALNLDENKLRVIRNNTFRNVPKIRSLSLKSNQLTLTPDSFFPDHMDGLENLEMLDLRYNPLGFVPDSYFSAFGSSLKTLVLASTVPNFYIEPKGLNNLIYLETLDLSNALLTTLPHEMKYSLESMQLNKLHLHGNKWTCDCKIRWLKDFFKEFGEKLEYRATSNKLNPRLDPMLQPSCSDPLELHNKLLFGEEKNSVKMEELRCAAKIYSTDAIVKANVGSSLTLMCKFFSDPPILIKWYKDDILVQEHWPRISQRQSDGTEYQANLTITSATMGDEADWKCILDDGLKKLSANFDIKLKPKETKYQAFYTWIGGLNTGLVLKYTGLAASCLVLLLMLIGLIVYCFYGKSPNKQRRTQYHSPEHAQKQPEFITLSRNENSNYNFNNLNGQAVEKSQQHFIDSHRFPRDHDNKIAASVMPAPVVSSSAGVVNVCPLVSGMDEHNLLLNSDIEQKVDDYVAFRVVSPCNNNVEELPLHQVAYMSPDGTLFIDNQPTCTTTSALVTSTDNNTMTKSNILAAASNDISCENMEHNEGTNSKQASNYAPCPLHGHLLSTLRKQNKAVNEGTTKNLNLPETSRENPTDLDSNTTSFRTNDDEGYSTSV